MTKTRFLTALAVVLLVPILAQAETPNAWAPSAPAAAAAPAPSAPAAASTAATGAMEKVKRAWHGSKPVDFQSHKEKVLSHISQKLQQWQQKQSCVQAASSDDAIKSCMPPRKHKNTM